MDDAVLPIEVCESILDELCRDRGMLWACCLVCRAWLPRSRCNLYSSISIDDAKSLDLFHRRIILDPEARKYLSNSRELHLLGPDHGDPDEMYQPSRPEFIYRALLPLATGLGPTVTYLEIRSGSWIRTPTMYSPPMQLTQFISVAELALNMCKFGTFSEMQRLIQALPSLARIHLRFIECRRLSITANEYITPYSNRPRLSTLDIRQCSSAFCDAMFSWLPLTESTQTLSVFEVNDVASLPKGVDSINQSFLGSFLDQVGSSLKYLHVDCLLNADLDLSRSMEWRCSLRLLQTSLDISRDSSAVRRLARILSDAAFNELCVINLAVDIGDISADIDLSQWKDIDDLCSLPNLPTLRAFAIKLTWSGLLNISDESVIDERVGQIISKFRDQLSGIHGRGVLLVTESVECRMSHFANSFVVDINDLAELISTFEERSEDSNSGGVSETSSVLDS